MIEKVTTSSPERKKSFEKIRDEAIAKLREFESEENFIDEGGAGKVYQLPGGLCMKVLIERHLLPDSHKYNLGNTVEAETVFQEQMARTSYEGKTRVPKTVAFLSGTYPIERSAIVMEKLDAVNLQHVINGQAELPENFNIGDFFDDLAEFITHMHTVEKIAHMDLYARNIMIDTETGEPRMIDFGRSVKLGQDPEKDRESEEDDWKRYDEIYGAVQSLPLQK